MSRATTAPARSAPDYGPAVPTIAATILERQGNLVRLRDVPGWVVESAMGPCRQCQGRQFAMTKNRLFCVRCVRRLPSELVRVIVEF
jgi:hypothetical protein